MTATKIVLLFSVACLFMQGQCVSWRRHTSPVFSSGPSPVLYISLETNVAVGNEPVFSKNLDVKVSSDKQSKPVTFDSLAKHMESMMGSSKAFPHYNQLQVSNGTNSTSRNGLPLVLDVEVNAGLNITVSDKTPVHLTIAVSEQVYAKQSNRTLA